ncbi:MAG: hypothetical protein FWG72_03680 [Oscillospiraceae bacterium]|nr:hypothetical protein [Oscillospiraceae bacterium]
MKSDIYTEEHGMETILAEMDRIGQFCKLSRLSARRLRLIAEEMLSLTVRLFDNLKYEFYAENNEKHFTLNLTAETAVTQSKKDKMLSLSTSGKNKAAQGLFGKISSVFESLLVDGGGHDPIYVPYYDSIGMATYFSLSAYRDAINETPYASAEEKQEQWDGLEKSIIATLAKDVVIGVRSSKVEMIVAIEL